jgi:hypothetical protein
MIEHSTVHARELLDQIIDHADGEAARQLLAAFGPHIPLPLHADLLGTLQSSEQAKRVSR